MFIAGDTIYKLICLKPISSAGYSSTPAKSSNLYGFVDFNFEKHMGHTSHSIIWRRHHRFVDNYIN